MTIIMTVGSLYRVLVILLCFLLLSVLWLFIIEE